MDHGFICFAADFLMFSRFTFYILPLSKNVSAVTGVSQLASKITLKVVDE